MSNTSPVEVLLWEDVETTGLDAHDEHLLQVASIVTDLSGNQLSDEFERIIQYPAERARQMRADSDPYVRSMHDRTGLWQRLPFGFPVTQVDAELFEFLRPFAPEPRQARLAGNSLRLDFNFTEVNLPTVAAHLHYRTVDVSALAYVLASHGVVDGYYEKQLAHNALDDIRESIAEFRWLLAHLAARPGRGVPGTI